MKINLPLPNLLIPQLLTPTTIKYVTNEILDNAKFNDFLAKLERGLATESYDTVINDFCFTLKDYDFGVKTYAVTISDEQTKYVEHCLAVDCHSLSDSTKRIALQFYFPLTLLEKVIESNLDTTEPLAQKQLHIAISHQGNHLGDINDYLLNIISNYQETGEPLEKNEAYVDLLDIHTDETKATCGSYSHEIMDEQDITEETHITLIFNFNGKQVRQAFTFKALGIDPSIYSTDEYDNDFYSELSFACFKWTDQYIDARWQVI